VRRHGLAVTSFAIAVPNLVDHHRHVGTAPSRETRDSVERIL
jgi:hypothetical protein